MAPPVDSFPAASLSSFRDDQQLTPLVIPGRPAEVALRPLLSMGQHQPANQQQQQQQQLAYAPPHLRSAAGRSLSISSTPRQLGPQLSPAFLYQTSCAEEAASWPARTAAQHGSPVVAQQPPSHPVYRPTPSLAPFAPFHAIAGPPSRMDFPSGPYPAARAPSAAIGSGPVGRSRKLGAGHRTTDSIGLGPPPKAKLGGAAAAGLPKTPFEPAVVKKKVVVRLPRSAAADGENEPFWVRALPLKRCDEAGSVDAEQPVVLSKEVWPSADYDRADVERGAVAVYLPTKHAWEKLKQARFEAMMLAQGIDVRGDQDHLVPPAHLVPPSIASRSPGVFDHRSTSSLSYPTSASFTRPSHRSSPSVASVVFARPYRPLQAVGSSLSKPSPFSLNSAALAEMGEAMIASTHGKDGSSHVLAPIPRRGIFPDSELERKTPDALSRVEVTDESHLEPWKDASGYSAESLTTQSDEYVSRWSQMPRRASLVSFVNLGELQPVEPDDDIISNPSDEGDAGTYSRLAMARLDARHSAFATEVYDVRPSDRAPALQPAALNLDPRAPPFVFGRPTAAALQLTHFAHQLEQLGSPVKLSSFSAVPRPVAQSSAAAGLNPVTPTFLSALNGALPNFDRPLPSLPISNLSTKRPFNVAAPEFQPRARPAALADDATSNGETPYRFVTPQGLLTLPLSTPDPVARSLGGRPLPTPPAMAQHFRHEEDVEPTKRSRTHEPSSFDGDRTGHLPVSSPRSSPRSSRGLGGVPIERMSSFKMPVGPVSLSTERSQEQETLPFAFDTSSVKRIAVEDANAAFAETGRSDTVVLNGKQRPPIPIFGSPPGPTLSARVAPVTPTRPLPAIPVSTPSHDARRSLAGSVITDDDEFSLASVRRRLKSGPPSSSEVGPTSNSSSARAPAERPGHLDDLVRRIQVIIDDKLNSLRLSGTRGGIIHLASLHPDAERSLLGRLAAMLEERDAVNGLSDCVNDILDAVEEGYRVVCERLEGSVIENLEALWPPRSLWEAVTNGLESQSRQTDVVLTRLERLDDHASSTAAVIDTLLPRIEASQTESADSIVERILPRLDDLKSVHQTEDAVARALRRALTEDRDRPDVKAFEQPILSVVSEAITSSAVIPSPAPSIDVEVLLRRFIDAVPVSMAVDLSDVSVAIQELKVDLGQLRAVPTDLAERLTETLKQGLTAIRERDSAPSPAEVLLSDQLRASEAERARLSSEVQALLISATEHRFVQQLAEADKAELATATDEMKRLEAERADAKELEREAAVAFASKEKEIATLRAKVDTLEHETKSQKSLAYEAWHARDIFESTIVQQLESLSTSFDQTGAAEERNRELTQQLVSLEKRLAVSEEKLQSQQRAASASAAMSKTALANASLKLQEAESTVRTLTSSLQAAEIEQHTHEKRIDELENGLALERAQFERLQQASVTRPETPRASQQQQQQQQHRPPSEASSWTSPHPLVRHLQDQVRPLSPPLSTLRPSHQIAATVPTGVTSPPPARPATSDAPKGSMASIWAPRPQPRTSWDSPSRGTTPMSRPVTVKPPDESDDGWWTAA